MVNDSDDRILERIGEWQAAGLIDGPAAERLREHEATRPDTAPPATRDVRSAFDAFSPSPSIPEVFAYLGAGFILAAYYAVIGSQSGGNEWWQRTAIAFGVVVIVSLSLGLALRGRGPRFGRAAGVLFALSVGHLFAAVNDAVVSVDSLSAIADVVASLAALVVAVALRRLHPSLLTQLTMIGSVVGLAATGSSQFVQNGLVWVAADLAVWGLTAAVLGTLVLAEDRSQDVDPPKARRSAVTRFSAGVVAVVATAGILITHTGPTSSGEWGPLIEPALAGVVIVAISLLILGLAIRRGSTAHLYPAALGMLIALTYANAHYIVDQAGLGGALLIEGLVLLLVGVAADRLRRRLAISRGHRAPTADPGDTAAAEPG